MKISGKNPESGEQVQIENDKIDNNFIKTMSIFDVSEEKVKVIINKLDISADAKSMLFTFSKATIRMGEKIIKIGRKIIDYICRVFSDFPSASFGLIFGAIAGFLISTIPILGVVLGPLFTPIAIIFGLVIGIKEDLKDKNLARKIQEVNLKFKPLNA